MQGIFEKVTSLVEQKTTTQRILKRPIDSTVVPLPEDEAHYWKLDSDLRALKHQHNSIQTYLADRNLSNVPPLFKSLSFLDINMNSFWEKILTLY
jgi:hypothetical protein